MMIPQTVEFPWYMEHLLVPYLTEIVDKRLIGAIQKGLEDLHSVESGLDPVQSDWIFGHDIVVKFLETTLCSYLLEDERAKIMIDQGIQHSSEEQQGDNMVESIVVCNIYCNSEWDALPGSLFLKEYSVCH